MQSVLEAIRDALAGTPWIGEVFLVGGGVRDELLGRPRGADLDFVTELDLEPILEHLRERLHTGPPQLYPRFGTAMLKIGDAHTEWIRARKESYRGDSRKPDVGPGTLLDDALRRDFTVNTLMQRLDTGDILDLTGRGRADLEGRMLRTPLDPVATMHDDPLRLLRAVRFRWTLHFAYDPGLEIALQQEAPRLNVISAERIRDEMNRMMVLPDADGALRDLMRYGMLDVFAPELRAMVGVEQGAYHHLDVWEHSLLVLKHVGPGHLRLAWAALLHDVGKPRTRMIDAEGATRFFGHETVGADIAREMLGRLRFGTDETEAIVRLVKHHMRLGSTPSLSPSAARRLVRDLGPQLDELIDLVEADTKSLRPGLKTLDVEAIRDKVRTAQRQTPRDVLRSPLNGEEIMAITGLEPGRKVGAVKHRLTEAVIEGALAPGDQEGARALIEAWMADGTIAR